MNENILFVDDEPNILTGFKRQLGDNYNIVTAESGTAGLECAKNQKFAVVISDFKMPQMNGNEFLMRFRELYPDAIRIMLTGQADMDAIVNIINEGNIFRFLTKPCPAQDLKKNIDDALTQYALVNAEKELLTKTLTGAIQVMTDMLVLARPQAFNRSIRIRDIVRIILSAMKVENSWQIEIAAMLSQIGCVTIPDNVLEKMYRNLPAAPEHKIMFQQHLKTSSDIISKIPRLEKVAEIIALNDDYDGRMNSVQIKDMPIGARILKIALDYDQLLMMDKKSEEAFDLMRARTGRYDESILELFAKKNSETIVKKQTVRIKVKIGELNEDMKLAQNVVTNTGIIIGESNQWINKTLLIALSNYAINNEISNIIEVFINK